MRALLKQQYTLPRSSWMLLALGNFAASADAGKSILTSRQTLIWCLPTVARQVLQYAACLNAANTAEKFRESLTGPHNGPAKLIMGFPSELMRYIKIELQPKMRASVNVMAPVLAQVLNAAVQMGLIPSHVDGGLVI